MLIRMILINNNLWYDRYLYITVYLFIYFGYNGYKPLLLVKLVV